MAIRDLFPILQGCYVDKMYIYGGRLVEGVLVEEDTEPWHRIDRVRLTPVPISKILGANVVKIPLYTR